MTELLVSVSMRFPGDVDQHTLSVLLAPVVRAAVAAGGLTTNLSVQPSPDATESVSLGSAAVHTGEEASPTSPQLTVAPHGAAAPCGGDR